MQIVSVFLAITTFHGARCALLQKPQNQYGIISYPDVVVLKCASTLRYRLTWLIKKPGSASMTEIFNGYNLIEGAYNVSSCHRVVEGMPGNYELHVNATKEVGQQYICLEPGSLDEASAEVTIIESHPECNVTTSYNGSVSFTCHVRFRGNWSPAMEWRNGISGEVIIEEVYAVFIPNESLTSRLTVQYIQSLDSNTYYICSMFFRIQDKPLETTADNIPSYLYYWASPTFHELVGMATKYSVIAICTGILPFIIVGPFAFVLCVRWTKNLQLIYSSSDQKRRRTAII